MTQERNLADAYERIRAAAKMTDAEALLEQIYLSFLQPGSVAYDVGAHVGRHAWPMAERIAGDGARLVLFEAIPRLADGLRAEAQRQGLGFVEVRETAIGAESGLSEFVVAEDSIGYSGLREREYDIDDMRTTRIAVNVETLDDVSARETRLDYVKIDIEGGECDALRGGRAMLARLRPAVSFEFGRRSFASYGRTVEDMFEVLDAADYEIWDIFGLPLRTLEAFRLSEGTSGFWDYLAFPRERQDLQAMAAADCVAARLGVRDAVATP